MLRKCGCEAPKHFANMDIASKYQCHMLGFGFAPHAHTIAYIVGLATHASKHYMLQHEMVRRNIWCSLKLPMQIKNIFLAAPLKINFRNLNDKLCKQAALYVVGIRYGSA